MTSAENSVSEPPNLKILGGGYPQTPYKARAFGTRESAPLYKKPSYGPEHKHAQTHPQAKDYKAYSPSTQPRKNRNFTVYNIAINMINKIKA